MVSKDPATCLTKPDRLPAMSPSAVFTAFLPAVPARISTGFQNPATLAGLPSSALSISTSEVFPPRLYLPGVHFAPRRNSWSTLKSLAGTFVELMETHQFSNDLHPAERRFLQEVHPSCLKFQHCQIVQKYGYTKYKRPSKQNLEREHVSCQPLLRK